MCIQTFIRGGSIAATLLALAACGGSDSGSSTGQLTIGLTDGPIDSEKVEKVIVAFTGIELKPEDGPPIEADIDESACDATLAGPGGAIADACYIDLKVLQGEVRTVIFSEPVPAGTYQWIRLHVEAKRNVIDSYLETAGDPPMMCSLYIPSGAERGLQLIDGITVSANGTFDYTLDFDLRKSITAPPGLSGTPEAACVENYLLKPVLRIVDTTQVGTIAGTVSAELLGDAACPVDAVSQYENVAVYVFDDAEANAVADDIDGEQDPVTTASVVYDVDTDTYSYQAGFLLPQDYRLALTCSADLDMAEGDEFVPTSTDPQEFSFIAEGEVSVETGATAIFDFAPPQS